MHSLLEVVVRLRQKERFGHNLVRKRKLRVEHEEVRVGRHEGDVRPIRLDQLLLVLTYLGLDIQTLQWRNVTRKLRFKLLLKFFGSCYVGKTLSAPKEQ